MGTQKSTKFFGQKNKTKKKCYLFWDKDWMKEKRKTNNKEGKNGNELLLEGKSLKNNGWLIHGGNRQKIMVWSLG
jgi:hypothetical protein